MYRAGQESGQFLMYLIKVDMILIVASLLGVLNLPLLLGAQLATLMVYYGLQCLQVRDLMDRRYVELLAEYNLKRSVIHVLVKGHAVGNEDLRFLRRQLLITSSLVLLIIPNTLVLIWFMSII